MIKHFFIFFGYDFFVFDLARLIRELMGQP